VIVVHDIKRRRGIALGNETPGILKRTGIFLDGKSATIGMNYSHENYPFRKWIAPGESWSSPLSFLALYRDSNDPFQVIDGPVNDYVRRHMGIRLAAMQEKPVLSYNTWHPFRADISDTLIEGVARAAADCGVEEFIIDAGWSKSSGDWLIRTERFPRGLTPVFDTIRSLGMKPGLWISLGTVQNQSRVWKDHPEWFMRNEAGRHYLLHTAHPSQSSTACFGTGWYDYIRSLVLDLVKEYGLEYLKLDFAVVASGYRYDTVSGCHAADHPYHRDWEESHLVLYRRVWDFFDDLHREFPGLFIDCTFETMGAQQLIDYDMCKHAEGNWLSNFKETGNLVALRVRHMAWWRSPVIPASALVMGFLPFDDPDAELMLMSVAGAFPIMMGDPRHVPPERRERFMQWSRWLDKMQDDYDFLMYRQDLPGFGEPTEGRWDGFQRINTDARSGGIIGVFRHGSPASKQQIFVNYLDPEKSYTVLKGPAGKEIGTWTGRQLGEEGFSLTLEKNYDGILLEIRGI
jgi:alpha-galactosidase